MAEAHVWGRLLALALAGVLGLTGPVLGQAPDPVAERPVPPPPAGDLGEADIGNAVAMIRDLGSTFGALAARQRDARLGAEWTLYQRTYHRAASLLEAMLADGQIIVGELPPGQAAEWAAGGIVLDATLDGRWLPDQVRTGRRLDGGDWAAVSRLAGVLVEQLAARNATLDWDAWAQAHDPAGRLPDLAGESPGPRLRPLLLRFWHIQDKFFANALSAAGPGAADGQLARAAALSNEMLSILRQAEEAGGWRWRKPLETLWSERVEQVSTLAGTVSAPAPAAPRRADFEALTAIGEAPPAAIAGPAEAELRAEVARLREEMGSLRTSVDSLGGETKSLRGGVEEARSETRALGADVETLTGESKSLRADVEAVRAETDTLRAGAEALADESKALRSDVDALGGETASLRGSVEAMRAETDTLRAGAEALAGSAKALSADVAALGGVTHSLRADVGSLGGETKLLRGDTDALRADAEALAGEAKAMRTDMEALGGESKALRADVESLNDEAGAVRGDILSLAGETRLLRTEIDALNEDNAARSQEIEAISADVRGLDQQVATLAGTVAEQGRRLAELAEAAASAGTVPAALEALTKRQAALEQRIVDLGREVGPAGLASQLADLRAALDSETGRSAREVQRLEARIRERLRTLSREVEATRQLTLDVQTDLSALRPSGTAVTVRLYDDAARRSAFRQAVAAGIALLAVLVAAIAFWVRAARQHAAAAAKPIPEEEPEALQAVLPPAEANVLRDEFARLRDAVESERGRTGVLAERLARLSAALTDSRSRAQRLEADLAAVRKVARTMGRGLLDGAARDAAMEDELARLRQAVDAERERAAALQARIDDLKAAAVSRAAAATAWPAANGRAAVHAEPHLPHRPAKLDFALRRRAIEALQRGDLAGFERVFAELTALPPSLVEDMVRGPSGRDLAMACRAADIAKAHFAAILILARRARPGEGHLAPRRLSEALSRYDQISAEDAERALRAWRVDANTGAPGGRAQLRTGPVGS